MKIYRFLKTGTGVLSLLLLMSSQAVFAQNKPRPATIKHLDVQYLPESRAVNLRWEVAPERNPTQFIIERSLDSINYRMLGELTNKKRTTESQNYYFTDPKPVGGKTFYRIRQIVNNKDQFVTKGYVVKTPLSQLELVQLFLSQDNKELGFAVISPDSSLYRIYLSDLQGNIKSTYDTEFKRGANRWSIYTGNLKPGVYFLQINNPKEGTSVMKDFQIKKKEEKSDKP